MNRFLLATCFAFSWATQAATYNLYFNNVEQGDHSTANPGVTVTQEKVGGDGSSTTEPGPASPLPPGGAATSVEGVATDASERNFRLSLGVVGFAPGPSGVLMLGYRPRPYLGFRVFAGNNHEWAGADMEFASLWNGALDGSTRFTVRPLIGWVSFWDPDSSGGAHVGARAEVEFDKNWELFASGRLNFNMTALEGGVTWKF